ncbi:MAG: type I restriction-modification system subunit M [Chloroflexi bacterium]|uniref:type I restriction-modification system subunit M n=1 Tax=Candidatus Flexifilum breve TaxID=3140694 RepID=UPI003136C8FE|nr:type I restriction-modification system subunit M [Chloroflexota bacterium]
MTNTPINQDEINAILWRACDTFRGTIDPSEYKNYILVMLFVKYISDVWREQRETLERQFPNDPERIEKKLSRQTFRLPKGSDFYSLWEQRNAPNIGEEINIALAALEEANKEKLERVFRNIDFNSEAALGKTAQRNERLKNVLNDFADPRLDLRPSRVGKLDIIGNAYEYLISRFASDAGKKAGEFYTPAEVSELLARLLDPQPNERICDPACGSGSLLIRCAKHVGSEAFSVWGQEANGATWALCMMNMFLHEMPVNQTHIKWGDTINEPMLLEGDHLAKFNVVVANPPFSLDKWGAERAATDRYERFHRGVPPKSKGDYAFITHMIETTFADPAQNGRVGVIVPHGVLFRGSSEGAIRQRLIDENLLDAVIGLPPNLFFGTGIPAAILIFKRNRADDGVLFIDASREFEAGTNQNRLRESDLARIVATYCARQPVEKYAALATREQIATNDYNLNIPRYVDTFEAEEKIDLRAVQAEIDTLETKLADVKTRMAAYLKELGLE